MWAGSRIPVNSKQHAKPIHKAANMATKANPIFQNDTTAEFNIIERPNYVEDNEVTVKNIK